MQKSFTIFIFCDQKKLAKAISLCSGVRFPSEAPWEKKNEKNEKKTKNKFFNPSTRRHGDCRAVISRGLGRALAVGLWREEATGGCVHD